MSGNFAIKGGGGVGPLMANAILNFHFDFLTPSLRGIHSITHPLTLSHILLQNPINSVNSFNSYGAVLPPSPMVFFRHLSHVI